MMTGQKNVVGAVEIQVTDSQLETQPPRYRAQMEDSQLLLSLHCPLRQNTLGDDERLGLLPMTLKGRDF